MEEELLSRAIEAILFAAGERIDIQRLAFALETDPADIEKAADALADAYAFQRRGIRILKLEKGYQMVSSGEMADYVTKALETRKPPKLSSSQLETLTIIAYYQPATKAMVEQIRGVDSAYSVSALLNKKLIEEAGRLNVPGRPIQYRTTPDFLRTFGLSSLEELPPIEKIAFGEPIELPQEQPEPSAPGGDGMTWWLAAGLLAALALLPLGIRFSYRENRGQLRLKIGPVVWTVYPKREKPQQTEPPEQAEKTQEQGEETSSEAAPKSVPSPQSPTQKTSLRAYLPLLRLGLDLLGDLRRKIRMDRLEFHLLLAGGDPCDLAVNYGRTWAAVGALLPQLERLFVIRKRDVQIQCDFAGTRSCVTAGVDVTITLGRLLALLAVYGVRGLKEYRTLKGKGGAEHESETSQHAGNNHSENP